MIGKHQPATFVVAILCAIAWAQTAAGQQNGENFTYHSPGEMTFHGDRGVKDRHVFFPMMTFPLRVGPEAGADGKPLRAFANSQVFRPDGFDVNDQRLYTYPWVDTLCESRHSGGPMPVCPDTPRHQGVDIRPNAPVDKLFDVLAWADGIVTFVLPSGTSEVNVRFAENNGMECVYLHLKPVNVTTGQQVRKGDLIGKVSNLMVGGTSIHLHFQCKATHPETHQKVNMPVYTSLVAAYRRQWQLPDLVENEVLLRDPERETDAGPSTGSIPIDPTCSEPMSGALASATGRSFAARYLHNCSEMGLAVDAVTQRMELVYVRPKQSLQQAAERKPVLVSGVLTPAGDFTGDAVSFNLSCGDPSFKVTGHVDTAGTAILLQGDRQVLDNRCNPVNTKHETLRFAKLDAASDPHTEPSPVAGLNCPFALAPGQEPQVVGGREIPPKSERSCNFTALTVPGNLSFNQMPRYIREWPGVRKDVLIDRFEDQIITFQSAETGVGAWWYWLTQRAVNGPHLANHGFGASGQPTLAAVARAIAGAERSEDFVRKTYLAPYLTFASEFFGRPVTETETLDLSREDVRWNLGRTMFRLESGRTPVVSRKQFDCGIELGSDVDVDFAHAGVETGSATQVQFQTFKGLEFYTNTCTGSDSVVSTTPDPGELADALAKLGRANQQNLVLNGRIDQLQHEKEDLARQLQLANVQVVALQRQVATLTSAGPSTPNTGDAALVALKKENLDLQTRIQNIGRELQLTNQMLDSQREICKLKDTICTPQ